MASAVPRNRSSFAQREVKQDDDLLLHGLLEIHQQVSAADQVQPREGRVGREVLRGENNLFADLLEDLVTAVLALEKPLQPFGRNGLADFLLRIASAAGGRQGGKIVIGGEDLDAQLPAGLLHLFGQHHGQAVGLLARRAARDPDPDRRSRPGVFDDVCDNLLPEELPCLGLAEKFGHADQQVFLQKADLVGMLVEKPGVVGIGGMPAQRHPPADPPNEGVGLVAAEIVPDFGAKDIQDVLKLCVRFPGARLIPADFFLRLLGQGCNRPGHGPGCQNRVRHAGIDGALRHFGGFRAAGRFHKRPAAEGLDLGKAQRSVSACARQHDAAAAPAKIMGEGAQEMVDGHPHAVALNRLVKGEPAPRDIEEPVGRHDVDPVGQDRHPIHGFNHLK